MSHNILLSFIFHKNSNCQELINYKTEGLPSSNIYKVSSNFNIVALTTINISYKVIFNMHPCDQTPKASWSLYQFPQCRHMCWEYPPLHVCYLTYFLITFYVGRSIPVLKLFYYYLGSSLFIKGKFFLSN